MSIITGKTCLVALLGQPVNHSLSPIIHNAAYREMGLDWCYLAIPCEKDNLEKVAKTLRLMNCKGINITIPYKQEVLKVCNQLTPVAHEIQAVNTLIPKTNNQWMGANTDVEGFLMPLKNQNLNNKNLVVIGCGGSARAIVTGLKSLNPKQITIIGRNPNALNIFIQDMNNLSLKNQTKFKSVSNNKLETAGSIEEASLIVNTTPVGMNSTNNAKDEIPLGLEVWNSLSKKTILYDLIYSPRPTNWLKLGEQKNCLTIDGLEMLIHQGALSLKLWSGFDSVPIETMKSAAQKHLMI